MSLKNGAIRIFVPDSTGHDAGHRAYSSRPKRKTRMFTSKTHLFEDNLGLTYAFTTQPRFDDAGMLALEAIPPCRTYARQTLNSIVESCSDPFYYGLRDLWLEVYQRPWAQPANAEQLLNDLAVKVGTGELRVYLEDSPLWHLSNHSASGEALSVERKTTAPERADTARVQEAPAYADSDEQAVARIPAGIVPHPLSPVMARKQRYQERQQLIAQTFDRPTLNTARERLAFNNDNILRAEAAQYVYQVDEHRRGHISELPAPPVGLELIDHSGIPGLEDATFTSQETGFGAALFKSNINGEAMLTYRGTNNGVTGDKDWPTNFKQSIGIETEQYNQAMDLAEMSKRSLDEPVSVVGHSLGGGLASAGVAVTGLQGYTFNAAGLHQDTAARRGGLPNDRVAELIQTQAVEGEILTATQKHGNTAATGLLASAGALVGGYAGAALGMVGGTMIPELPHAVGEMQTLRSVKGGNPIARHGMDQVIDGIEAQKEQDIQTLINHR